MTKDAHWFLGRSKERGPRGIRVTVAVGGTWGQPGVHLRPQVGGPLQTGSPSWGQPGTDPASTPSAERPLGPWGFRRRPAQPPALRALGDGASEDQVARTRSALCTEMAVCLAFESEKW